MTLPLLLAVFASLFGLRSDEVPPGESAAFVEWAAPREAFAMQEPVRLTLRFGIEKKFLEENLIQIFGRPVDVPVALEASAFSSLEGVFARDPVDDPGERRASTVLNGARVFAAREGDRSVGGRAFAVFAIERTVLPLAPGVLVVAAPVLRFSYATRFEEDFFNGRVPAEKRDAAVAGSPLALRVDPWPEGRPREFGGAVGRFTVAASAEPREVAAGESLKLALRVEGEGNCELFAAPRLEAALPGFHVYGMIEEKSPARRLVTYDVAPLGADVTEVPEIAFSYFEPASGDSPGAYRTVRTEAIPLVVRGIAAGAAAAARRPGTPGVDDIHGVKPLDGAIEDENPLSPLAVAVALVAPFLLALATIVFVRAREREKSDPRRALARRAAAAFAARLAAPGADPIEAFAEYLAARLHSSTAAVIAHGLAARLHAAGVPDRLAARAAAFLESGIAARYGGGGAAASGSADAARALVSELERSFP